MKEMLHYVIPDVLILTAIFLAGALAKPPEWRSEDSFPFAVGALMVEMDEDDELRYEVLESVEMAWCPVSSPSGVESFCRARFGAGGLAMFSTEEDSSLRCCAPGSSPPTPS